MTTSPSDLFTNEQLEDFASYLGLSGADADMFYESYYNMDVEDLYQEEEYRDEMNSMFTY